MKWLYKSLALTALRYLRTRVRLDGQQSAAWSQVIAILDGI